MEDALDNLAMDEADFKDAVAPRPTLPQNAARAAGWGMLALFAVLGFVAWKKYRR